MPYGNDIFHFLIFRKSLATQSFLLFLQTITKKLIFI